MAPWPVHRTATGSRSAAANRSVRAMSPASAASITARGRLAIATFQGIASAAYRGSSGNATDETCAARPRTSGEPVDGATGFDM